MVSLQKDYYEEEEKILSNNIFLHQFLNPHLIFIVVFYFVVFQEKKEVSLKTLSLM